MARLRTPANVQLRRAQLTLMLATLIPTILITALGILLLALGNGTEAIVIGVLVLTFCTTSLTGYILGSIFVFKGASVARFQNDFLSLVSHELRTPLTSILLFIESLQDERLTDPVEKQKCLGLLDREVRRLQDLVERLIRLSRMEAGHHQFSKNPVALENIVEYALSSIDAVSINNPATIETKIEPDLLVFGDREALGQAVGNLLVNAWKYTPAQDKKIYIDCSKVGKNVEIVVSDNGPGIPKDEQKRIFERFERGKSTIDSNDRSQKGSGLGLAIVKAVVEAHKGKIELRQHANSLGAEFCIQLPFASDAKKAKSLDLDVPSKVGVSR